MQSEMTVRPQIAQRFWEQAMLAELAERYREQGFDVQREVSLHGTRADLVARSGDRIEVVEVKGGVADRTKLEAVKRLRNYVATLENASFKLVWATPPSEPDINIEGLEDLLNNVWSERLGDTEVVELATTVVFDSVVDVELESLLVNREGIEISGSGLAEFELQYGSGDDDGFDTSDSYPFSFHLTLTHSLEVDAVHSFSIDVSSFYE